MVSYQYRILLLNMGVYIMKKEILKTNVFKEIKDESTLRKISAGYSFKEIISSLFIGSNSNNNKEK